MVRHVLHAHVLHARQAPHARACNAFSDMHVQIEHAHPMLRRRCSHGNANHNLRHACSHKNVRCTLPHVCTRGKRASHAMAHKFVCIACHGAQICVHRMPWRTNLLRTGHCTLRHTCLHRTACMACDAHVKWETRVAGEAGSRGMQSACQMGGAHGMRGRTAWHARRMSNGRCAWYARHTCMAYKAHVKWEMHMACEADMHVMRGACQMGDAHGMRGRHAWHARHNLNERHEKACQADTHGMQSACHMGDAHGMQRDQPCIHPSKHASPSETSLEYMSEGG
eukprot:353631-Chlamydomonas_euryale.AAC.7